MKTLVSVVLVVILVLAGCCKTCPPVPPLVTKCPAPPQDVFVRPELSISTITTTSKAGDIMKAYVLSVGELQEHVGYLEGIFRGYQ